jgi:mannose-6-phosphate isomerase-like protein (cupin superfamily)
MMPGGATMNIVDINHVDDWFLVMQTTERSQTAVMILTPGGNSSEEMSTHRRSDQVLLLLEGELYAEVGGEKGIMTKNQVCLIPAGTPHRFENLGKKRAVTFNVYSPPEYSPGEKG